MRPQDRPTYLGALQQAEAANRTTSCDRLLYQRLDGTLDEYLSAAREALG